MLSRDPAVAVQAAIWSALTASPDMIAAFGGPPRVYDRVPLDPAGLIDTAKFPYVTIGEDQIVGMTNQCTDPSEIFAKIEVWSRSTNKIECKTIAGAVRTALDAWVPLAGHDVIAHTFHGVQYRRESDGLTDRAIITIRYITGPAWRTPLQTQP